MDSFSGDGHFHKITHNGIEGWTSHRFLQPETTPAPALNYPWFKFDHAEIGADIAKTNTNRFSHNPYQQHRHAMNTHAKSASTRVCPAGAMNSKFRNATSAALLLLLSSCLSPYDAQSHKQLTDLKAYHVKFLEDNTAGAKADYSKNRIMESQAEGDLQFRQGETYAASIGDTERTNNFQILHEGFMEDTTLSYKKGEKFSKAFGGEIKKERISEYDLAIKGETVRKTE